MSVVFAAAAATVSTPRTLTYEPEAVQFEFIKLFTHEYALSTLPKVDQQLLQPLEAGLRRPPRSSQTQLLSEDTPTNALKIYLTCADKC